MAKIDAAVRFDVHTHRVFSQRARHRDGVVTLRQIDGIAWQINIGRLGNYKYEKQHHHNTHKSPKIDPAIKRILSFERFQKPVMWFCAHLETVTSGTGPAIPQVKPSTRGHLESRCLHVNFDGAKAEFAGSDSGLKSGHHDVIEF
jgi:hypothetical protein